MNRYIFLLLTILCVSIGASAAPHDTDSTTVVSTGISTTSPTPDIQFDYKSTPEWGKYKALRTVGWSALGVGVTATAAGLFFWLASNTDIGSDAMALGGSITAIAGAGITLASVPILCVAYHNRYKAKKMALNLGVTHISNPVSSTQFNTAPALSLSFNF